MVWFGIAVYLTVWGLGLVCLWFAYQIRFKRRYSLIRDGQRKPLPHAYLIAAPFAFMAALAGVLVLGFAVAIPVYRLQFGTWHLYIGALVGVLGVWRYFLFRRHAKLVRSNPSLHLTGAGKPAPAGELKRYTKG